MPAAPQTSVRVEYMRPFIDSLKALFEGHLRQPLTIGKPFARRDAKAPYDVSAVIAFTGTVVGRAVISFPMEVAQRVVTAYLQIDPPPPGALHDCVGELANIIVGRAKSSLANQSIMISPPTVIAGRDYQIAPQRGAICVSIPITCELGPMQFDISIAPAGGPGFQERCGT